MMILQNLILISVSLSFINSFTVVPRTTSRSSSITRNNNVLFSTDEATETTTTEMPGTAEMDKPWGELGFEYRETKSHLKMIFRDGKWGEPELVQVSLFIYLDIEHFHFILGF